MSDRTYPMQCAACSTPGATSASEVFPTSDIHPPSQRFVSESNPIQKTIESADIVPHDQPEERACI